MERDARDVPGSKPIGLAIGVAVLVLTGLLPALVVLVFYLFANVQAIVTGTDFGARTLNVPAFLTGLVVTVALLVVGIAAVVNLLGRALSPKRR